jgi:hypothetical protein
VAIYIEYISRLPGVPLEAFHAIAGPGQGRWSAEYSDDRLILNLGRTWRLGPEPEYVAVWYTPKHGLERIAEWERVFTSGEADAFEKPFELAARIDHAGCYEPLLEPVAGSGGPYYAEFFRPTGDPRAIRALYDQRAQRHAGLTLNLLARRIGRLAPDPGGLAVWTVPSLAAVAGLAEELDAAREPVELVDAGTYADTGQEIL